MIRYYTYTHTEEYPGQEEPQFATKEQAMIDVNIQKENYDQLVLWHVVIDSDTFIHMEKVCRVTKKSNGMYAWLWFM